jgi:hypothetical protein
MISSRHLKRITIFHFLAFGWRRKVLSPLLFSADTVKNLIV